MYEGEVLHVLCEGKLLDRARVVYVLGGDQFHWPSKKITARSLESEPGKIIDFVPVEGGWARLFPDPMTNESVKRTRVPPLLLHETGSS